MMNRVWLCDLQADGSWLARVIIAEYDDFAVAATFAARMNACPHLVSDTTRHFAQGD